MQVVILGNGAAGLNALKSFRRIDKSSSVTLVSAEPGPAYSRVLLPYFLRRRVDYANLFIRRPEYYEEMGVGTCFADPVREVDLTRRIVILDSGKAVPFDRLLIATGASPVNPPIENLQGKGVYFLRTLDDVLKLEPLFKPGNRVIFLGAGFCCLQGAWAAHYRGLRVKVVEIMDRILPNLLDEQGSWLLSKKMIMHEVDLRLGVRTRALERRPDGSLLLHLEGQPPLEADFLIVSVGVFPNTAFLRSSGMSCDTGIPVDARMETGVEGIYAAGDVAMGPTIFGESHVVQALWPTAMEQGAIAGSNMAGLDRLYRGSLNMNITEIFGLTVASIGRLSYSQGYEIWERHGETKTGDDRYLQVVLSEGVPVGGVLVGDIEVVKILGFLRTLILNRRAVAKVEELLDKRDLHTFGLYRSPYRMRKET